ncbi:MAG: hypothetical protein GX236_12035 [Clostridiaceae bacterium]|jgi:hypothetical protein|nr:hypothetical protein [Clostridiaceae bacterium]
MVTIEQIDEFRKRTHSSYEDAKYFLEKNNGDVLDAIIDFERTKSNRVHSHQSKKQRDDFGNRFADILQKGFDTKLVVEDKGSPLFAIPIILLILLLPIWVFILLFFILLTTLGYKLSIKDEKSQNVNVNSIFQNINNKMKDKEKGTGTDAKSENYYYQPGKSYDEPKTEENKNNNSQVPVQIKTDWPGDVKAQESKNNPNNDEGYNEYTIE